MNRLFDRRNEKFLRGHQLTDASGTARFTTIYPGWYTGRAVHLHFSVRAKDADKRDVIGASQSSRSRWRDQDFGDSCAVV
jgi:protocatechuate 3,4-dioxygenase beta subunit